MWTKAPHGTRPAYFCICHCNSLEWQGTEFRTDSKSEGAWVTSESEEKSCQKEHDDKYNECPNAILWWSTRMQDGSKK